MRRSIHFFLYLYILKIERKNMSLNSLNKKIFQLEAENQNIQKNINNISEVINLKKEIKDNKDKVKELKEEIKLILE